MFHDVSSKQDFIMFNVQTIVSKVCPEEEVIERPEGMPPIPLKSFENISLVDEFLSEKRHRRALVSGKWVVFNFGFNNFYTLLIIFF